MKTKHYRLTVTLTDAPPVRIYTADWPTIAHIPDGLDRWIVVRRHKDGRTLVSAVNRELDPVRRAGYLLAPGNPAQAIRDAADAADLNTEVADQAIAALPVESLEDDGTVAVWLTRREAATVLAALRMWNRLGDEDSPEWEVATDAYSLDALTPSQTRDLIARIS